MSDELYEDEAYGYESEADEFGYEAEDAVVVRELGDSEVDELAMELLDISSEEELDQFLGSLAKRVVRGAKAFAKSSVGKAIGGALKSVAKKALPMAGAALGSLVPGVGTAIGGTLGSMASKLLEAEEAEMMGEDEAEQEAARRYVRWAAGTIRNAARAPHGVPAHKVVRSAAIASARRYAPALVTDRRTPSRWRGRRGPGWGTPTWGTTAWGYPAWQQAEPDAPQSCTCGHGDQSWGSESYEAEASVPTRTAPGMSGRWVRRGQDLIVIGGAR